MTTRLAVLVFVFVAAAPLTVAAQKRGADGSWGRRPVDLGTMVGALYVFEDESEEDNLVEMGSGRVWASDETTIYVATARHVVDNVLGRPAFLQFVSPSLCVQRAGTPIRTFEGVDLALITFDRATLSLCEPYLPTGDWLCDETGTGTLIGAGFHGAGMVELGLEPRMTSRGGPEERLHIARFCAYGGTAGVSVEAMSGGSVTDASGAFVGLILRWDRHNEDVVILREYFVRRLIDGALPELH